MMYLQYRRELNVVIVKDGTFFVEFIFGDHGDLKAIQYCKNSGEDNPKESWWPIGHISESGIPNLTLGKLVRYLFIEESAEVFFCRIVK